MTMHYHWARLIETLHAAEMIKELLSDPDLYKGELVIKGQKKSEGVGLIEAPRELYSTITGSMKMTRSQWLT